MHTRDFDLNLLHVFQALHRAGCGWRCTTRCSCARRAAWHRRRRPSSSRAGSNRRCACSTWRSTRPTRSTRRARSADQFLPLLMAQVRQQAPGVRIEAVRLEPSAIGAALEEGRIDLAFGYLPELTGTEQHHLLDERYVVLLRQGHPLAARLRDRTALQQLDFILVASHIELAKALHLLGLESRIRLTLPHFTVAPSLLAASDLAVVMPLRPARRFAARHALQVVEPMPRAPRRRVAQGAPR